MALNADGFHSDGVGLGPLLQDSEISFTGDDFLNIHNRMNVVCRPLGTSGTTLAVIDLGTSLANLRSGDELRFYELLPHIPTSANPYLGLGIVDNVQLVTDLSLLAECRAAGVAMQQPPYNALLIGVVEAEIQSAKVYAITFQNSVSFVEKFNLVNFDQRSGSNFVVKNNYFHDSVGTGGRIIGKAMNGTFLNNVAERFGGIHIYSEQCWLEGALGIRNVFLDNNTVRDARVPNPGHVDVMAGLKNITCVNTTFIVDGKRTRRRTSC